MSDKLFLSIPVYNGIIQYLNNQPHGAVRPLIDAIEREVMPQVQAAQAADENTIDPEVGLTD